MSCKGRGLCPSCGAKRAAAFAAFLHDEVLEPVGHCLWTFSIPRMTRPYFMFHRELLGKLCHAAYETVQELMAAAVEGLDGFRTGMVAAVQTAGDALGLNPHLHTIVPRGGWDSEGQWVPVPFVDTDGAEKLFCHKVLSFLMKGGLLSEERMELLLSWRNHTGFSVDASVKVEPENEPGLERLARYILRSPVSLERMRWDGGAEEVAYRLKPKGGQPRGEEHLDPLDLLARCARGDSPPPAGGRRPPFPHSGSAAPSLRSPRPRPRAAADGEFLARLIAHVPEPKLHTLRYFGHYSNVSRGRRSKGRDTQLRTTPARDEPDGLTPAERQARRRAWARLIRRVYEISPLTCAKCGAEMKVICVILDPAVIKKILDHIRKKKDAASRAPPDARGSLAAVS